MNLIFLESSMTFGERAAMSGQMIVLGMCTVFVVLAILWGVLSLFKVFMYDMPAKKKAEAEKAAQNQAPVQEAVAEPEVEPETETGDDETLIAVLTAAIAAYESENGGEALPFRVISFKRRSGASGWNATNINN